MREEKGTCCWLANEVLAYRLSSECGVMGTSSGVGGHCVDDVLGVMGMKASLLRIF